MFAMKEKEQNKSVFWETQREKAHIRAICVGESMCRLF